MANELRVRADGVAGALSADMDAADTTLYSGGLQDLPAIGTSSHAAVSLFTTDNNGRVTKREIVWVTAHSEGTSSATVSRGMEGTTAQDWVSGDKWTHSPTALDFEVKPDIVGGNTWTGFGDLATFINDTSPEDTGLRTGDVDLRGGRLYAVEFSGAVGVTTEDAEFGYRLWVRVRKSENDELAIFHFSDAYSSGYIYRTLSFEYAPLGDETVDLELWGNFKPVNPGVVGEPSTVAIRRGPYTWFRVRDLGETLVTAQGRYWS